MGKEEMIRPSLLSADFSDLGKDIDEAISLGVSVLHYDVMDGSFVEDISFGEPVLSSLLKRYQGKVRFDAHLMVSHPLEQTLRFVSLGVREIAVHYEAMTKKDYQMIPAIRRQYPDLILRLAINPSTTIENVSSLLSYFDGALVMSVVPGKGGQSFLSGSEEKITQLKKMKPHGFTIGVDGGINDKTSLLCLNSGADYLVMGSFYFKTKDKKDIFRLLEKR